MLLVVFVAILHLLMDAPTGLILEMDQNSNLL